MKRLYVDVMWSKVIFSASFLLGLFTGQIGETQPL